MKYSSRKFIIAVTLIIAVFLIFGITIDVTLAQDLPKVIPSLIGLATAVFAAVAIMYPFSNVLESYNNGKKE